MEMTREKRTVVIKALFHSFADPFLFSRSEVLGNKGGKGISEFLYRHIGERVYFYCCRKGGHDYSAKTVDQSLYHENAQIHYRLLYTGQCGERSDLFQAVTVEMQVVAV